ncbi:MAG: hypothetical protein ACTHL8_00785 [Burkholderiaceae bacterium]
MNRPLQGVGCAAALGAVALGFGLATATAANVTSYQYQKSGVTVAFGPSAGTVVTVGALPTGQAFQGIGTNLGALSDLNYVPCAKGSTNCTAAPTSPKISAKSVRASLNLPFTPRGASYVDPVNGCTAASLSTMGVHANNVTSTLAFLDTWDTTPIYKNKTCSGTPVSMRDTMGTSTGCGVAGSFQGACLMDGTAARNVDWVEVFFTSPLDYLDDCTSPNNPDCDRIEETTIPDFAWYRAAQLVYQGRFGNAPAAPKYIELFNEPEGTWNVQVTPDQYEEFLDAFVPALRQLANQRSLAPGVTAAELNYLKQLKNAALVAPALGASYLADWDNSGQAWDTSKNWFDTASSAKVFHQRLRTYGASVSTHTYDDKRTMQGLNVQTGLQRLIDVRNASQSNQPVVLSEAAETVQNDAATAAYVGYCQGLAKVNPKTTTEGACGAKYPGDPTPVSYPDCVVGATINGASYAGTPIADFCHHQAAKLLRNLANFGNSNAQPGSGANGVVSELIWVSSPSNNSSEHGLVTRQGLPSLMNAGTDPLLANFAIDGYVTVFPVTYPTNYELGVGLFASAATSPQRARLALSNTSSTSQTVTLNFASSPMAQFTKVLNESSSFGGASAAYTGTTETIPAGTTLQESSTWNFGTNGHQLVVTLPANSGVTLTLAP